CRGLNKVLPRSSGHRRLRGCIRIGATARDEPSPYNESQDHPGVLLVHDRLRPNCWSCELHPIGTGPQGDKSALADNFRPSALVRLSRRHLCCDDDRHVDNALVRVASRSRAFPGLLCRIGTLYWLGCSATSNSVGATAEDTVIANRWKI